MQPPATSGQRVAFFGGSFDPPHLGHLAIAQAAYSALHLDTVLFAPVGSQPLKPNGPVADFSDRVQMTRLAIADNPAFHLSLVDAPKPSGQPNYTFETLEAIHATLPPNSTLCCLLGADSLLSLRKWHRAAEIPFLAPLIIAARPGQDIQNLNNALPEGLAISEQNTPSGELLTYQISNTQGRHAPLYLLPNLHAEISASDIRHTLEIRHSLGDLSRPMPQFLPSAVADYIAEHQLYRTNAIHAQ